MNLRSFELCVNFEFEVLIDVIRGLNMLQHITNTVGMCYILFSFGQKHKQNIYVECLKSKSNIIENQTNHLRFSALFMIGCRLHKTFLINLFSFPLVREYNG